MIKCIHIRSKETERGMASEILEIEDNFANGYPMGSDAELCVLTHEEGRMQSCMALSLEGVKELRDYLTNWIDYNETI